MIESRYRSYLRETGAELDIHQFEEIFGMRYSDPGVRIARAVERWFDAPQTAAEQRIHDLIRRHRDTQVTRLEREIFTQRKRLADAERKLAMKITRAAQESRRIAMSKVDKARRDLPLYAGTQAGPLDARIFPFHYAPVVVHDNGRHLLRLARYHLRPPGTPATTDRKFPGLYNARRDNLTKFWRPQFGATHAVMLVESFYENVTQEDRNVVLHFVPRPAEPMFVACLYGEWQGEEGKVPGIAAITDEPPPEVAAAGHDRMIVSLQPRNVARWLSPTGRSDEELQSILHERRPAFYEHEVLAA